MPVFEGKKGLDLVNKVSTFDEDGEGPGDVGHSDEELARALMESQWVTNHPYSDHTHTLFHDSDEEYGPLEMVTGGTTHTEGGHEWEIGSSGRDERGDWDRTPWQNGVSGSEEDAKRSVVQGIWDHYSQDPNSGGPEFQSWLQNHRPAKSVRFPYGESDRGWVE